MTFYATVVSSKGRVAIPTELRKKLEINKGTRVTWSEEDVHLVLTPITERRLDQVMGFLKRAPGKPSVFEASFAEGERELRREK